MSVVMSRSPVVSGTYWPLHHCQLRLTIWHQEGGTGRLFKYAIHVVFCVHDKVCTQACTCTMYIHYVLHVDLHVHVHVYLQMESDAHNSIVAKCVLSHSMVAFTHTCTCECTCVYV